MKMKMQGMTRAALSVAVVVAVALVAASLGGRTPVAGQQSALRDLSEGFSKIAEQTSPSVVFITVSKEMRGRMPHGMGPGMNPEDFFDYFFGPGGPNSQMPRGDRNNPHRDNNDQKGDNQKRDVPYGQGSGFIISPDGYILTNHHVVGDADKVSVKLADGREFDAKIIGSDAKTEVALIKIEATGLPALALGDSDKIRVGEWVVAIGNPFGLEHSVTAGIVSARGRGNVGITDYADFIQTDAAINPGNSGGPLLNLDGQVIGMNTAILSRTGGYMGVGLAIPANMIKYIESQLREKGTVSRGYLGISMQQMTQELAKQFNAENGKGILVGDVVPDSPAAKAGFKQGDVIVSLDGRPVDEPGSFSSRISTTLPGSTVPITVLREGKEVVLSAVLGEQPKDFDSHGGSRGSVGEAQTSLGITVQNLTDELAQRFGYEKEQGVVIAEVEQDSGAAQSGLQPGMLIQEVNRKPVHNTNEFEQVIKESKDANSVLLLIRDGKYSRFVVLKLKS
jgi:serine protease Do